MIESAFLEERRDQIVKVVAERGRVSTKELSDLMGTSVVTIRSDINELANRGLLVKTHGGALSFSKVTNYEPPSAIKSMSMVEEKKRIAKCAASLIVPGDVVILDAGSTTFEIAKCLEQKTDITVVTNDLQIAEHLARTSNVELVVTGGTKARDVYTLSGPSTIRFFESLHADKLFLGCDAIDFDFGITNRLLDEASIKMAMINACEEVIAVADSSKLAKKFFAKVCPVSKVDKLITDGMDRKNREKADAIGLDYVIV